MKIVKQRMVEKAKGCGRGRENKRSLRTRKKKNEGKTKAGRRHAKKGAGRERQRRGRTEGREKEQNKRVIGKRGREARWSTNKGKT